jgi:hypothetical protein
MPILVANARPSPKVWKYTGSLRFAAGREILRISLSPTAMGVLCRSHGMAWRSMSSANNASPSPQVIRELQLAATTLARPAPLVED